MKFILWTQCLSANLYFQSWIQTWNTFSIDFFIITGIRKRTSQYFYIAIHKIRCCHLGKLQLLNGYLSWWGMALFILALKMNWALVEDVHIYTDTEIDPHGIATSV